MSKGQMNLFKGEAGKATGMLVMEGKHGAWLNRAREIVIAHARTHGCVSADDLRQAIIDNRIEPPQKPNEFGGVFNGLVLMKKIRCIDRTKSVCATNHGREIRVYALV